MHDDEDTGSKRPRPLWKTAYRRASRALRLIGWNVIRNLGSLQILTRASYAMLVVVPLLAGVWVSVSTWIHSGAESTSARIIAEVRSFNSTTNAKLTDLAALVTDTAGAPDVDGGLEARRDALRSIGNVSDSVNSTAEKAIRRVEGELNERRNLPPSWAAAFFAALAVALGHFTYQTWAPPTVKTQSLREYQEGQTSSLRDRASSAETLREAAAAIGAAVTSADSSFGSEVRDCLVRCFEVWLEFDVRLAPTDFATADETKRLLAAGWEAQHNVETPEQRDRRRGTKVQMEIFRVREQLDGADRLARYEAFLLIENARQQESALATLKRALEVQRVAEWRPEIGDDLWRDLWEAEGRSRLRQSLPFFVQHHIRNPFNREWNEARTALREQRVWAASREEYLRLSRETARPAKAVALGLYSIALLLLALITLDQSVSVLQATGLWPTTLSVVGAQ